MPTVYGQGQMGGQSRGPSQQIPSGGSQASQLGRGPQQVGQQTPVAVADTSALASALAARIGVQPQQLAQVLGQVASPQGKTELAKTR